MLLDQKTAPQAYCELWGTAFGYELTSFNLWIILFITTLILSADDQLRNLVVRLGDTSFVNLISDKVMLGGKFFRLRPEWLSGFQRATWHCRWRVSDRQQKKLPSEDSGSGFWMGHSLHHWIVVRGNGFGVGDTRIRVQKTRLHKDKAGFEFSWMIGFCFLI